MDAVSTATIATVDPPDWSETAPLQRQLVQEILIECFQRHIRRKHGAEVFGDLPLVVDLAQATAAGVRAALKHLGLGHTWGSDLSEFPEWGDTPPEITETIIVSLLEAADRWGKSCDYAVSKGLRHRADRVLAIRVACDAAARALGYQPPAVVYI